MFGRLGRLVVHNPWKVIIFWVIAAIAIVSFAPTLNDVTNRDQASFLPSKYESVQAQELAAKAFTHSSDASATIVFKRDDNGVLTPGDQVKVGEIAKSLNDAGIDRVAGVVTSPAAVSPNQQVQLVSIGLQGLPDDPAVTGAVKELREKAAPLVSGTDLKMGVTGDAALMLDNTDAFEKALAIVGAATFVLIIGLLLLIFRSPIAALLPILSVGLVTMVATPLIALAAKVFGFQIDQSLPTMLTVVLYGVGTDYIVFLLFRYRERLRAGDEPKQAMIAAVERVGEAIASAAGAIIIAFSALLLAVFGGFRSLGPGLSIAVAVMLVAALTLVPAIVSLLGTKVFWPSKSWQHLPKGTVPARAGRVVGRRPGVVVAVSGGLLLVLSLGALGFKANYDQMGQLPQNTESAAAFTDLQSGFPAGALNPTTVFVKSETGRPLDVAALEQYAAGFKDVKGVGGIMPGQGPGATGSLVTLSQDGQVAKIDLLLADNPYSNAALDTADGPVRDAAHAQAPDGTKVMVGGVSATFADIRDANDRDLTVIFPVAGLLIAVILALLLRSLVAPLYLMLAVVLGFTATLGASVLAFQVLGDAPGLSFSLPIILYLFVVAIGTDYNILMIARLREEAKEGNDPRRAAALAVEHAGPSIAAAGLILAGTFAAMLLSGLAMLTEIGFSVSAGIVLSAFVMSMFLVPGITALIGHRAWWPGHGDAPLRPAAPDAPALPAQSAGAHDKDAALTGG